MLPRPPISTLFPYTTLFRSRVVDARVRAVLPAHFQLLLARCAGDDAGAERLANLEDRKSTRLNSSHLVISYAVFCLKKKTTKKSNVDLNLPAHETLNPDEDT